MVGLKVTGRYTKSIYAMEVNGRFTDCYAKAKFSMEAVSFLVQSQCMLLKSLAGCYGESMAAMENNSCY
jgi:hypothetical protein